MWQYLNKGISTPIAIGIVLILVILVSSFTWWQFSKIQIEENELPEVELPEKEEVITTFEECVTRGYLILESYPRQCKTPDGKIFIEEIIETKDKNEDEIVVGLEEYHVGRRPCWEKGRTVFRAIPLGTTKFLEYLDKENIKTIIIDSELTTEILDNIDVLIVACPIQPFTTKEKEVLRDFLKNGKGLLLSASHLEREEEARTFAIDDLAESLNLSIKFNTSFCTWDDFSNIWTEEIKEHQVTSEIDAVLPQCGNLDIRAPVISLVEQKGKAIYAIQYYSKGKIGAIASCEVFTNEVFDSCHQCQELNLNLIKWLASPEIYEEMG